MKNADEPAFMKKPNLKFTTMFHVPSWGDKIIEGWATPLNHIKHLSHYEDDYLFYPIDGTTPHLIYKNEIFQNYDDAVTRLEREKKDHIEYHKKQVQRSTEFLLAAEVKVDELLKKLES